MNDLPIHEEWTSRLVPSHHRDDVFYRVVYGTVDWERNGDLQKAVFIFMQVGNEPDWNKAKAKGQIIFRMTPHILDLDLTTVLEAIRVVSEEGGYR